MKISHWDIAKVTACQACSGYKKAPPRFTAEDMLNPEFLGEHMSTINIQNNRRHAENKSLRAFC